MDSLISLFSDKKDVSDECPQHECTQQEQTEQNPFRHLVPITENHGGRLAACNNCHGGKDKGKGRQHCQQIQRSFWVSKIDHGSAQVQVDGYC